MATPNEKLAELLAALRNLQKDGKRIFQSSALGRIDRERLLAQGFLREVIKGWLVSASPNTKSADTTPWYASFWEFCTRYCADRFGKEWHLSPEQSLLLHAEHTVIPAQVVIYSPRARTTPSNCSSEHRCTISSADDAALADLTEKNGVRLYTSAAAGARP